MLAGMLLAGVASPAWAGDGSQDFSDNSDLTKTVCAKADRIDFPAADLPDGTDEAALKDCLSRDLYYGIGGRHDYRAARKCAFIERAEGRYGGTGLSGSVVLMMIYANGLGVRKNYDLALKAACEATIAAAETDLLVERLTSLQNTPPGARLAGCDRSDAYCRGKVDMCGNLTSGFMGGQCAAVSSALAEERNSRRMRAVVAKWPSQDQALFKTLNDAAETYFGDHAWGEIDRSGTLRDAFSIDERDRMRKAFRRSIVGFENGKPPMPPRNIHVAPEDMLAPVYDRLVNHTKFWSMSQVSTESIRAAQKSWLAYRDAWLGFAAVHYKSIPAAALKTWLYSERIRVLNDIPTDED